MKIAIIGSGISGLTAAYLLNKKHKIKVFEANNYIGGHTHTHTICFDGSELKIDSGFIVYNENTYPNFIQLLQKLNVTSQLSTMGFSVKSNIQNLEYSGNSLNALFAQRSNLFKPVFLRMLGQIYRFNKKAQMELQSLDAHTTLYTYLSKNQYSRELINHYIIPMGAAIWSSIPSKMLEMPAKFFIRFFKNHGLLKITKRPKWWVIQGGSNSYIEKIITGFRDRIHLSKPIASVQRTTKDVTLNFSDSSIKPEVFDKVVFANHSDQALSLITNPSADEKEILGSLPYQKNEAILHWDESILPKRKSAWSSWNYSLDNHPEKPVAITYNMNILQSLSSSKTFCVTLNQTDKIDPKKIIKRITYHHPIFTTASIQAQRRKKVIDGKNNSYFCGAYWRNGFHEDGVVSALEVGQEFGLSI